MLKRIIFCVPLVANVLVTLDSSSAREKWPTRYQCGFIAEKNSNGKSTSASCSLSPEIVLSTRDHPEPPWKHCEVERVYGYSDLIDFLVDIERGTVSWKEQIGLIESAKKQQVLFYINEEGLSKEEAHEKADRTMEPLMHHYTISDAEKIMDVLYFDKITGTLFDPPQKAPAYLIVFGTGSSNFSLYISGASNQAILSQYASIKEAAWVTLRFGRCRKIE